MSPCRDALRPRFADIHHRADAAGRRLRRADCGAEVHDRLGIIAGALARCQFACQSLQLRFSAGQRLGHRVEPRHDPLDIAVDHRGLPPERDGGDRGGRVNANSGQSPEAVFGIREPAAIVHNDYTARSGIKRLHDHFADALHEAERLMQRRFAIINVWRSIAGPVLNHPLVICDATTVRAGDLVSMERRAEERTGELQVALYNPDQRWYYFPAMQMNEALLFKTFDSATDGRARFTIHSSFDDPTSPADAPPRTSIETRCLVFF